jgi:hypothetical protein
MLTFEITLEVLAMLVSLLLIRYSTNTAFRWITAILFLTAINEAIFIPYIIKHHLFERNIDYNIFSLADMLCWYAFFISALKHAKGRKYMIVIVVLIGLYSCVDLLFLQGWIIFHIHSIMVYDISIIGFSVYYLFILLKKEYHNLWTDSIFFVCAGCILYHSIEFVQFASFEMKGYWASKMAFVNYDIVQNLANATYYLALCAAFFVNFYHYRKKAPV